MADQGYVVLEGEEAARWIGLISVRFGLPDDAFDRWVLVQQNRKLVSLANRDCAPPEWPPALAVGLPFIHTNMAFPKLTTGAARLLGPLATQHVIELTAAQADWYLRRVNQAIPAEQLGQCTSKGYVLLRHAGVVLGLGLLRLEHRPAERRPPDGSEASIKEVDTRAAHHTDGSSFIESLYPKAHALAAHRSAFDEAADDALSV
jgi:hypothetical protein